MSDSHGWGLTEQGFRRPSYTEILDAFEYQAREKFSKAGKYPDLTVRSPLGIFLRIWAWIVEKLLQVAEDVYNSRFIDTASGASLFQLGRILGLQVLPAQRSSGYLEVTGTPGVIIPAGLLFGINSGLQFVAMVQTVIGEDGKALVPIQCRELGEVGNVGEKTIRHVVTPIPGIESVTNPTATTGGQSRETSEQFRDRYYQSVDFAGGVNAEAIKAEILQTVEGVLSAEVYENDTDFYNAMGLPPHSIEAVVYAGMDHEIAQAIYRRKAAGIQTHGNTVVPVIAASGQPFTIHFTRPTGVPIWFRLENVQVDLAAFPADGADQIRQALVGYIGGDISGGLSIGEDAIYNKLPCKVFQVSGVIDFDLEISADGEHYDRENIPVSERGKAITSMDRIQVTVNL